MADISIRDPRNHGGEVVDRVLRGERLTVTRNGKPVAELRPVDQPLVPTIELIRRRAHLPVVDTAALLRHVDAAVNPSL